MTLYRKLSLGIFVYSSIFIIFGLFITYVVLVNKLRFDYIKRYESLSKNISSIIENLEKGTDDTMKVSLKAIRYYIGDRPIPKNEVLVQKAKELGISSIEIVEKSGKFIRSTKYPLNELPSLFYFCDKYRDLFQSNTSYQHTPFMPSIVDNNVQKYALMTTNDGKYVINVGMDVSYIRDLIQTIIQNDLNLVSFSMLTPSGKIIGSFNRSGGNLTQITNSTFLKTLNDKLINKDFLIFEHPVKATTSECCECVKKGLSKTESGFHYKLQMQVSPEELKSNMIALFKTLSGFGILGIFLSLLISRILAKKFTEKINYINKKASLIRETKDLTQRIGLNSNDEIGNMAKHFDEMLSSLEKANKNLLSLEQDKAIAKISYQVAHDIRSPLAALSLFEKELSNCPENQRIIYRSAVSRIKDIINTLSGSKSRFTQSKEITSNLNLLIDIVDQIVSEKRVQYKNEKLVNITQAFSDSSIYSFVNFGKDELSRILSNIIDNSIEAIQDSGTVHIDISSIDASVLIKISDNGIGIPKDKIPLLFKKGSTFGKENGTGLGLYSAKETLNKYGGTIEIHSIEGKGTDVLITLPLAKAPDWILNEIVIKDQTEVIILDDDNSIHEIWNSRFRNFSNPILHAYHSFEFKRLVKPNSDQIYFVDYELIGSKSNGLDIIRQLNISNKSVLVTSHYNEEKVRTDASNLGVKILPKNLAPFIKIITLNNYSKSQEIYLIDDDPLIQLLWKNEAKVSNINLKTYSSIESFKNDLQSIDRNAHIYMDLNIHEKNDGLKLAEYLKSSGFNNLHLETGSIHIENLPKGLFVSIQGKEPNFKSNNI